MMTQRQDAVRERDEVSLVSSDRREQQTRGGVEKTNWLRSFGRSGMTIAICIVAIGVAVWEVRSYFHKDASDENTTMYVCSVTGKPFPHTNVVGEVVPIVSPFTGKNTGYPAVPCFWTAAGDVKADPTWVIMNVSLGKTGPTFCPDCGRLVDVNRPKPKQGERPPRTQDELLHARSSAAGIRTNELFQADFAACEVMVQFKEALEA